MSKRIDIRGKVYNNILPLRFIKKPSPENTHAIWKCKCLKCGKATFVTYSNIVSGNTKSCASCGQLKLSKKDDKEISLKYLENTKIKTIANEYGVGRKAIYNSLHRTDSIEKKKQIKKYC